MKKLYSINFIKKALLDKGYSAMVCKEVLSDKTEYKDSFR